jgi:hypothetical protein
MAASLILPLCAWHLKLIRTPLAVYSRSAARQLRRYRWRKPAVAVTIGGQMIYASYIG